MAILVVVVLYGFEHCWRLVTAHRRRMPLLHATSTAGTYSINMLFCALLNMRFWVHYGFWTWFSTTANIQTARNPFDIISPVTGSRIRAAGCTKLV